MQQHRNVAGEATTEQQSPSAAACAAQVPRALAAALNPLISDSHAHVTLEDVADLIDDVGLAVCVNDEEADGGIGKRLHQQIAVLAAAALRYEARMAADSH